MLAECWTIIAIIFMMCIMFLCTGKRSVAIALIPTALVPLVHICTGPVVRMLIRTIEFPYYFLVVAMDIVGIVLACLAMGIIASFIKQRALRNFYIATCGGFALALDLILLYYTVGPYLM